MRINIRQSTTVLSVSIATALLILAGVLLFLNMTTAQAVEGEGRLVTIHDRDVEKVVLTEAETIADALAESGIVVDNHDIVEPGLDEKLIAREYSVNIYRARPVTVIDGPIRSKIITAHQTAEQIVQNADIKLYKEDIPVFERSRDFIGDGAGLAVTIDRAVLVNVDLYGSMTELRTQGETVAELLEEKSIELGENGRTSVSLSAPIVDGMDLRVWREGKQTVTVDEKVAFDVREIQDGDRVVGYEEIRTEGVPGLRQVTYEIVIENGVEKARKEIASITTKAPVQQVVVVGVKPVVIPYTGGGTKTQWLAASNIPEESWGYADFMVQKESSWNPDALNPSSGACGLAQALPCTKIPGQWNDPVNALNWMNNYVNGRYGGWSEAHSFWLRNSWY